MNHLEWSNHLDLLIRSRTPIIWIRSSEEERVETLLNQSVSKLHRRLVSWDFIEGLKGTLNDEGLGKRQPLSILQWIQNLEFNNPTILLLKDFHRYCEDPGISRTIRNLCRYLRQHRLH